MQIRGTQRTANLAKTGRRRAPAPGSTSRALTVRETAFCTGNGTHARPGSAPFRRASAFLAQLALQYDGVAARRRQRAERLEAAITGYGAQARLRAARRLRPAHDFKI